ncbi:MAG TPA: copper oxidase [Pseudomonadales bacterium]|nr:copper oxidase [Pseudomonadales bacterium]
MPQLNRRQLISAAALAAGAPMLSRAGTAATDAMTQIKTPANGAYNPVVTLNGATLPYKMNNGVKEFRLVAEQIEREFAPGMKVKCWGYNGTSPGPTIEVVEGDKVRIYVTNKLPEKTSVHWHGLFLPNGMDGVGGLTQPHIPPGKTMVYEFTVRQNGTFMYHPHSDEMVQMAMGMMGLFISHPKNPLERPVDRDYALLLMSWDIEPGTMVPKTSTMTDFNVWTFNSKTFPAIQTLVARTGERVRIRIGNLSMTNHPMHLHGFAFKVVGTDGGWIPESAQWPEVTTDVPVGAIRVLEFTADAPGDWAFHCHKSHHTMGPMSHDVPNMMGVRQGDVADKVGNLLPDYMYMPMGEAGMGEMGEMSMPLPDNTLPMMTGNGPFGPIEMGGMFTVLKVRDDIKAGDYRDPGWYKHPQGTRSWLID